MGKREQHACCVLQSSQEAAGRSVLPRNLEAPLEITVNMITLDGVTLSWI